MRRLFALGAVGVGGLIYASEATSRPAPPPLLDEVPPAAQSSHAAWLDYRNPTALEGWADAWFERFPPDPEGAVLIDRRHGYLQADDIHLGLHTTSYSYMHTYGRAMDLLRSAGVRLEQHRDLLTPGALSGRAGVFINLPAGRAPAFERSEVLTLEAFVRHGGALVLIVDHTNAYLHADVLSGMGQAFGFRLPPVTNADRGPGRTLSPSSVAWVRIRPLQEHPVTEGVQVGGILTGGVIEGLEGVIGSSQNGWQDAWNPDSDSAGFTGDLKRQPDEPGGSGAAVAVKQHGEGRLVLLGDQNAFGATMLGYEDNARIWTNAWMWALGRDVDIDEGDRVSFLAGPRSMCTSVAPMGFHTLYVQAARLGEWSGRRETCTAGSPRGSHVVMLPEFAGPIPQPARGVALLAPDTSSMRLLEELGLSWTTTEPVEGPLRWELPDPLALGLNGPVTVAPVKLDQDLEVLAWDAADRPLVVRHEAWLLVLDGRVVGGASLGRESVPRSKNPGAHDAALRLLGWLFTPPSH